MDSRANFTLICNGSEDVKEKYLQHVKNLHIQHRVVSFNQKAEELYKANKLNARQKERVVNQCLEEVVELLLNEDNVFLSVTADKNMRVAILREIKKTCKQNKIACWCSLMAFEKVDKMPDGDEGWNDMVVNINGKWKVNTLSWQIR